MMVHSQLAIGADGSSTDEWLPGNHTGVAAGGEGRGGVTSHVFSQVAVGR